MFKKFIRWLQNQKPTVPNVTATQYALNHGLSNQEIKDTIAYHGEEAFNANFKEIIDIKVCVKRFLSRNTAPGLKKNTTIQWETVGPWGIE